MSESTRLETDEDAMEMLGYAPGYQELYMLIRRNTTRSPAEAVEYVCTMKLKDKPLPFDLQKEIEEFHLKEAK